MEADYVHKDTLTATDYVELNKNNKLLISYNQALLKENAELKKQLENNSKINVADHKYASECEDKVIVLETQQKEFIKWLEDMLDDENDIFSVVRVKDVLKKYKGDDK